MSEVGFLISKRLDKACLCLIFLAPGYSKRQREEEEVAYCAVCNIPVDEEICDYKVEDQGQVLYFCTEEHRQEYIKNHPGAKAVED